MGKIINDFERKGKKQMGVLGERRKEKQVLRGRRKATKQRERLLKRSLIPDLVKGNSSLFNDEDGEETYGNFRFMDPELYTAAMEGKILELVEAFDKGPADRNFDLPGTCVQVSPQKNTILHIATSHRHYELVNLICKDLPFLILEKNYQGDTALHIAARSGDSLLVNLLLNAITEEFIEGVLRDKNEDGNTALHEALQHCHQKVARILVDKNTNITYGVNKEGKSLLYLAANAGYVDLVRHIMENPLVRSSGEERLQNRSPVHAALNGRNTDVLKIMWEKDQASFRLTCELGRNPLHYAASIGYLEGVTFLLEKFYAAAYQRDRNGYFPIHIASNKGYVNIIEEFLGHCPDSRELLTRQGQNILHIAAKIGRTDLVKHILKVPMLEKLINDRDDNGNTPLLLAAIALHPKVVSTLTGDRRVNLLVRNNDGLSALDIADGYNENKESRASFRQQLTRVALRLACAKQCRVTDMKNRRVSLGQRGPSKSENYKEKVDVILLVSTLIMAMTFSAGFTIPGGDNNSSPDQGLAIMLMEKMFHLFIICNTVAMYSSITVAAMLIWAHLTNVGLILLSVKLALPLLGVALVMMSVAFMAGMYLVVSKLVWLACLVLLIEFSFILTLAALFVPLCLPGSYYILHCIAYHVFRLMLFTFGCYNEEDLEG